MRARCVCQNIRWDGAGCASPACIHTLENGLRIGIVGIVTDYVNIWERPEHLSGITISDPIPAAAAALEELRGKNRPQPLASITVGSSGILPLAGCFPPPTKMSPTASVKSSIFDILLTGHQHMSVPGQMVSGTFVVQPSDRGQEFCGSRPLSPVRKKRLSSHTIPAGGACHPQWLRQFAQMEHGAQGLVGSGGRSPAPPAAAGCSPKNGRGGQRPGRPVQCRSAGGQRGAAFRRQPGQ